MSSTVLDTNWQQAADGLDQTSLRALIAGEVPAVRIADFATPDECAAFCAAIRGGTETRREAETSRMTLIGVNFSNYGGQGREGYFEQVEPSYRAVGAITGRAGFDPLARMIERLEAIWPAHVGVAQEPGYGRYFAGGIKARTTSGNLHYDFVPHTAPGFAIAGIQDQLGWNLYLDMPRASGQTTTYRRPVAREAGAAGGGPARALNLDRGHVDGAQSFTFRPRIGEVVIINTRYPHDIIVEDASPDESRVQTSSFIGRLPNDDLIMWS